MDLQIFQSINNLAGRWGWLDWLGRFLATDVAYIVVGALALIWLLHKPSRRAIFVAFLSAAIARGVFVTVIRWLYHRPRPISVDAVHQLVTNDQWAFPSGHASFFFALAMGIYLYNKKWGAWLFVFAALMGLARIFVGVHWPSDILAGALLGVAVGYCVKMILDKKSAAGRSRTDMSCDTRF